MALTQSQLEAQRKYRAKLKETLGHYSESQKRAQYNYLNKIRQQNGKAPIVQRKTKISENIDL